VFQNWIHLLVSHWGALDILSAFGKSQPGNLKNLDMALMSIKSPISHGSSIDWKDTIQALASHAIDTPDTMSFNANAAIKMLETEIESGDTDYDDCKIVKAFQSM
jgi:hypothetical protein